MKKALIVWGGWPGHEPEANAQLFKKWLTGAGFEVTVETDLAVFDDVEALKAYHLITPVYTMGDISDAQVIGLCEAVHAGVGLAGTHGGMGDTFRGRLDYEWMVGGHFLGHPHVGPYQVDFSEAEGHHLLEGISGSYDYDSEQYYMMMDPVVEVLATTQYQYGGKTVKMPVVWTKQWGAGRVFYSALGHTMDEYNKYDWMSALVKRGMVWAARD